MKRFMQAPLLLSILVGTAWCAGPVLTPEQVRMAVLQGSTYKTADQFFEKGLKARRVKLAGVMAKDGITKYATFFNDWGAVTAEAAAANQQMRQLNPADFRSMGLLHAFVEIHGRGVSGVGKLDRRYGRDRAHLVLQLGDGRIVQPVEKSMIYRSGPSVPAYLMGVPSGKITLNFDFDVSPQDLSQRVQVILIDGDGNKHPGSADLAGVLSFGGEE